jgi:hypothetical protein
MTSPHRTRLHSMPINLILEIIDPTTDCITNVCHFDAADTSDLCRLLNLSSFDVNASYNLDKTDLEQLKRQFALTVVSDTAQGILRQRMWLDNLPYQIHTNRELSMMLEGIKPLAAFCEEHPNQSDYEMIPEALFAPHVVIGRFIKRDYIELSPQRAIRRVLYSLPSEAWRIDAYILMRQTASITGWNDTLERMEGYLLGYEKWECDAYFRARKARVK